MAKHKSVGYSRGRIPRFEVGKTTLIELVSPDGTTIKVHLSVHDIYLSCERQVVDVTEPGDHFKKCAPGLHTASLSIKGTITPG